MPKVSIIVPVFGVEKFIERCARSLFEQTFADLEYIFVDDCTRDKSIELLLEILEAYPDRKGQVRIIHHDSNKGLPSARQTGMKAAQGKYILNCDSDDWIHVSMIQLLHDCAEKEVADIVIGDFAISDGTHQYISRGCLSKNKKQLMKDICSMRVSWSLCNKLFKRDLLYEDITFPVDNMGEDMALTLQLAIAAHHISYEPKALYYYYNNPDSITKGNTEQSVLSKFQQNKNNAEIVLSAFKKRSIDIVYPDELMYIKWNTKKQLWRLVHKKEYFTLWKDTYSEINSKLLLNPLISTTDKLRYVLTYARIYPRRRDMIHT